MYNISEFLFIKQRTISDQFYRKQEYGLTLLMSTDSQVTKYLESVLAQIQDWLEQRKVHLIIVSLAIDNIIPFLQIKICKDILKVTILIFLSNCSGQKTRTRIEKCGDQRSFRKMGIQGSIFDF